MFDAFESAKLFVHRNGKSILLGRMSNVQINLPNDHPHCRCQSYFDKPSFSWKARVIDVNVSPKKKALNLVKRLAARAIIYASIHQ